MSRRNPDPVKRFRPKPFWQDGPPNREGRYWVVFRGEPVVELLTLSRSYINRDNPDAPLLMSWGGLSYAFAANLHMFERHAIAWPPEHPGAASPGDGGTGVGCGADRPRPPAIEPPSCEPSPTETEPSGEQPPPPTPTDLSSLTGSRGEL